MGTYEDNDYLVVELDLKPMYGIKSMRVLLFNEDQYKDTCGINNIATCTLYCMLRADNFAIIKITIGYNNYKEQYIFLLLSTS